MHEPAGKRPGTQDLRTSAPSAPSVGPGKQPLVAPVGVQHRATGETPGDPAATHAAAAQGIATPSSPLPHMDAIQRAFGRHDVSGVQAHVGPEAAASAGAMGARAYATGDHVVLGRGTDLHTVAHEAAHVVQQRAGVHLSGGVGQAGDTYEQHADAVADLVVQGKSAEGLLDTHAVAGGGAARSAGAGPVQHKLEYAAHHALAPDAAKNAVKADQASYTQAAEDFELKLGAGLHQNGEAQAGVNAMLRRMRDAMTAAGMDEQAQHAAFGEANAKQQPDLGVVLTKDVGAALAGGNLREKMGMVYQARFKISEALDTLRQRFDDPAAQDMIGDELKSDKMGNAIDEEKAKPRGNASYAILERRNSVKNQVRQPNPNPRAEITEAGLHRDGIPLSDREQEAAVPGDDRTRKFVPGGQVYVIPPDVRKREQDNLRRVVAGLSGSADMYFHIANHLKMPEGERRQLRLATLGQMLANRDHSYHEIMHEAKTQGGLADYADELPIGYTQLAPLTPDQILATAGGLADFPGDAQIREISSPMAKSADIRAAAAPSANSKSYPAVLETLRAYESNPSKANLEAVVAGITAWLASEKPGMMSTAATRQKYNARAPHLERVLKKAQYLLSMENGFTAHASDERARRAQQALATDNGTAEFLGRIGDLDGDHGDWYSPAFRAQTSDLALDTTQIAIDAGPDRRKLGITEDLNTNLQTDTASSVGTSRWEIEGINHGDGRNVPDLENPGFGGRKKKSVVDSAQANATLNKDSDDFTQIDASDLQALAPGAPLGGVLKRFEGQPVPQELHALNAYTQAGFYDMMNHVLNKRADKAYMATPAGQTWWASVPAQAKQLISLAISGVRKMKPFTGDVYRGENLVHNIGTTLARPKAQRAALWQGQIPSTKRYNQFVSTSKRPYSSYIVKTGKYTAGHFKNIKSGVDVSALGGKLYEREVLFAPGTTFRVTNVEDRFDTTGTNPADKYGSRLDEAPPEGGDQGRIKVTFEET